MKMEAIKIECANLLNRDAIAYACRRRHAPGKQCHDLGLHSADLHVLHVKA